MSQPVFSNPLNKYFPSHPQNSHQIPYQELKIRFPDLFLSNNISALLCQNCWSQIMKSWQTDTTQWTILHKNWTIWNCTVAISLWKWTIRNFTLGSFTMNIGQTDTAQWAVLHKKRNNLKLHSGYFIVKSRYSKITQSKRKKIYILNLQKKSWIEKKKIKFQNLKKQTNSSKFSKILKF